MKLYTKNSKKTESGEEVGQALLQLIEENLNTQGLHLHITFKNFVKTNNITIIYDSDFFRISFMFSRQKTPAFDELSIEYGRLHAPNDEPFMIWNEKECRCWHNIIDPLRFLDGLSPLEAFQQSKIDKQLPAIARKFRQSEQGKKLLEEYPPKAAIALQSIIWKHYNQRLFNLFDLRKPKLWEEYRNFLKEYYRLLGIQASYGPPYENVC